MLINHIQEQTVLKASRCKVWKLILILTNFKYILLNMRYEFVNQRFMKSKKSVIKQYKTIS